MTLEELKFEVAMLEARKRRASFPQVVSICAYLAGAAIIVLSIALWFPGDTAPEWLLLMLAPAALGGWLGIGKLVEHWSPVSDWSSQDDARLRELQHSLFMRGDR